MLKESNDNWSGVPVYFNFGFKNGSYLVYCVYKKSNCKCKRRYNSINGFKKAHNIEF